MQLLLESIKVRRKHEVSTLTHLTNIERELRLKGNSLKILDH